MHESSFQTFLGPRQPLNAPYNIIIDRRNLMTKKDADNLIFISTAMALREKWDPGNTSRHDLGKKEEQKTKLAAWFAVI